MLQLALVGLLSVLFALYLYLVRNFNYWRKRGVAGPSPRPLLGNVRSAVLLNRNPAYDIDDIYQSYKHQHNFVGIFHGRSPSLLILDASTARDILVSKFKNFQKNGSSDSINESNDPIYGRNHFFQNGAKWKTQRMQITPAFTTKKMAAMFPVTKGIAKRIHQYIEQRIPQSIHVTELTSSFTAENVSDLVYGVQAEALTDHKSKLKSLARRTTHNYVWLQSYSTLLSFPVVRQLLKRQVIGPESGKFYENLTKHSLDIRTKAGQPRDDFLQHVIKLKETEGLEDIDVVAHLAAVFLDGYESSSITISQCLNMLARHKNVQTRLREELKAAVRTNDGLEISFTQLSELLFLDQCINETLRLFPPGKDLAKVCTKSCTLDDKNENPVRILEGDSITIPMYSIHRDERYYSKPNEFDPDRFSPENGGVKHYRATGAFMPFGDGPRICSGLKFAMMQIKTAIAEIISNWEVEPDYSKMSRTIEMDALSFLCYPRGGIHLHFKKLEN